MLNSTAHFFNSGKGCQKRAAAASNWYRFKCREGGGAVTKQIITSIWIISTTQYTQWAKCLLWPWSSKTDYFENTRQNLSSHLELVISENIWFFACYLSIDFYNKHRRSGLGKFFFWLLCTISSIFNSLFITKVFFSHTDSWMGKLNPFSFIGYDF